MGFSGYSAAKLDERGNMEIKDIVELIRAVSDSELTSFSYEGEEGRITMEAGRTQKEVVLKTIETQNMPVSAGAEKEPLPEGEFITSPMVGTFYAAPNEDAAPYISVGDTLHKGQVVGIIEAMKLMNEIESPFDGIVEEILVGNETMVGFDQKLVRVRLK